MHDVKAKLATMPQVTNLRTGLAGQISKDRHAELVQFDMKGKHRHVARPRSAADSSVARLQQAHPSFTVAEFGFASANKELNDTIGKDFQKAETLSLPITFLILLFAFGAFVAAGVPVLLAFTAVLGSIGLSKLVSHVAHASGATQSVMLLMGMAVGVDYSLFYLKREREERAAGHEGHDGLFRAAATSGQAVLISGVTVLIAMAGMLFAGSKIFTSIGIGAMLVVFTSLVGSLTVLPALLGKLGDRIERGFRQVLAAGVLAPAAARSRAGSCGCATSRRSSAGSRATGRSPASGRSSSRARCAARSYRSSVGRACSCSSRRRCARCTRSS